MTHDNKVADIFKAGVMAKEVDNRNYCDNKLIFLKDAKGESPNTGVTDCSGTFNHEYIHE
jgi:hypothetical protein